MMISTIHHAQQPHMILTSHDPTAAAGAVQLHIKGSRASTAGPEKNWQPVVKQQQVRVQNGWTGLIIGLVMMDSWTGLNV